MRMLLSAAQAAGEVRPGAAPDDLLTVSPGPVARLVHAL